MDGRGNRKQGTRRKIKAAQGDTGIFHGCGGEHHFLFMVLFIYGAQSTLAIEGKPGRRSCQQNNTPSGGIQMFVLPATRTKQGATLSKGLVWRSCWTLRTQRQESMLGNASRRIKQRTSMRFKVLAHLALLSPSHKLKQTKVNDSSLV